VYSVEGNLDKTQHERLASYLEKRSGAAKAGVPLVLDRSAKWVSSAMTGVDAQHVETRRLQIEEICRSWGVFPIMIGHSDKAATFASSEAFFSAHLIHTLAPWHQRWIQTLDEFVLDGSGPLFTEFDTRYMRAGSLKDRAQWARSMIEVGAYTRNEVREEDGKDPLKGLDEPLTPMNMTTGPDGCLYIVDMYRGIIQEGNWVREGSYLRKVVQQYGFQNNVGRGRIWRLVHKDHKPGPHPKMLEESPSQWVKHLAHPNGWWRDTAQRLLIIKELSTFCTEEMR
jgi:hypothetical protein